MALWAIAWVKNILPSFTMKLVHLYLSGHAMVPFRHHPPRSPPPPSPILKYCPSHLPPAGQFSSTRYSPHPCTTKILFNLAFEYSVPVVFIVSFSFLFITAFIDP